MERSKSEILDDLRCARDDPMWCSHAEISKYLLEEVIAYMESVDLPDFPCK